MPEDDKEKPKTVIKESQLEEPHDFSSFSLTRDAIMTFCKLKVPQLKRDERIGLYDSILVGCKNEFDFIFLMIIATAIASIGLAQNSTAVIIGAMLVAPLMTPILGMGLSLVQGNRDLMIYSSLSTSVGFAIALLVSAGLGYFAFANDLTNEMVSRGNPRASDLFVGLFSGMAAAYCKSRPHLSSAIPGVAIAAALVPPISTVGMCLAFQEYTLSANAATLFFVNVIAIVIGASLMFFAVGMRGRAAEEGHDSWVYLIYFSKIALFALILVYFIYFRHK